MGLLQFYITIFGMMAAWAAVGFVIYGIIRVCRISYKASLQPDGHAKVIRYRFLRYHGERLAYLVDAYQSKWRWISGDQMAESAQRACNRAFLKIRKARAKVMKKACHEADLRMEMEDEANWIDSRTVELPKVITVERK